MLGIVLSAFGQTQRTTTSPLHSRLHSRLHSTETALGTSNHLVSTPLINSNTSNKPFPVPSKGMDSHSKLVKHEVFDSNQSKIFEIIDKFRELGIQEDISLPQLVVVGDQSSGKSSLLEGLTKLPFPVASTICTRFATQITYKRTFPHERDSITVSIIPDHDRDYEKRAELADFARELESLNREDFSKLLEEAAATMGLPKPGEVPGVGARFSNDVLRIELAGPNRSHFTVVDVPGIFQSSTAYQSDEDAEIIERLVQRYIKEDRTIILAVASSLNETANQKVFRLAKIADPEGVRTVGVLTKPDAIQKGEEPRVLDVAQNNVTSLRLGWFVVRNRSTDEVNRDVSIEDRNAKEREFFRKSPWSTLPKDRVGIIALEEFLRDLLDDHVRREFPNLVKELDDKIHQAEEELEALGPRRDTPDQQRKILLKLANEFQSHSRNALIGYYTHEVLAKQELKIRMHVQNLNEEFAEIIVNEGHQMDFDEIRNGNTIEESIKDKNSIYQKIAIQYRETRGAELPGMVNPIVIQNLFNWQSAKWEEFAREHVSNIQECVELFNGTLLPYVCRGDKELERKLKSKLMDSITVSYEQAKKELENILSSERDGVLHTLDDNYIKEVNRARNERLEEKIKIAKKNFLASNAGKQAIAGGGGQQEMLSLITSLSRALLSPTLLHTHQSITEIHDILKSYYCVARKRFIDNVAAQVIERHYLGSGGPIQVFGPEWVGQLNEKELGRIAGEEDRVTRRREHLAEKLQKWKGARGLLSGF